MTLPNATAPIPNTVATVAAREPAQDAGTAPEPVEIQASAASTRLAAIVHLDMVGYSRLVGLDEAGTLARLQEVFVGVLRPLAARAGGRVANTAGDSALLVFPGAAAAMRFALAFQQALAEREQTQPADGAMRFRVGVTVADVLDSGADVHGDGVNVAARLQAACPPGAVCVSRGVRDQVQGKVDVAFEPLGALHLKNIVRPVEVYLAQVSGEIIKHSRWRMIACRFRQPVRTWGWAALAASTLLVGGTWMWQAQRPAAFLGTQASATALPDLSVKHAPRFSLVVLPFANTSGDPGQDYLADAVTDDLTTDLSQIDSAFVIGRGSAQTYRGRAVDARRAGAELGVRYIVQGIVRRIGDGIVRVNAELVSTETGERLWAERFDQDVRNLGQGQGEIVRRLALALGTRLVDVEAGRSEQEHPSNPDAFDLVLRAASLLGRGVGIDQSRKAQAMLERALVLDPGSATAMIYLAYCLMNQNDALNEWHPENMPRALELLHTAEKLAPNSPKVGALRGAMLLWQGRYKEGQAFYEQALAADPNDEQAYHQIGAAKLHTGDPGGALPFYKEALRRSPRESAWFRYGLIGMSYLRMRQPSEAAIWLRRAFDENPAREERAGLVYRAYLASALALSGEIAEARQELKAILQLQPFWTARFWNSKLFDKPPVSEQMRYVSDGLRLAGLRDHVDEDADTGVPSTGDLHLEALGPTPAAVPGAEVIRTDALQHLLAEQQLIILDGNATGRSLPGAVVLGFAFTGGSLDDAVQDRLRRKVQALTDGDLTRPIVAMGWNAERWGSRNLALRLVALGYTRVYWYRGGKEIWEVHNLPETDAEKTEW